jgi:hypothetical protein
MSGSGHTPTVYLSLADLPPKPYDDPKYQGQSNRPRAVGFTRESDFRDHANTWNAYVVRDIYIDVRHLPETESRIE